MSSTSTMKSPAEKKKSSVSVFFGSLFNWRKKSASCSNVNKAVTAAEAAAKAEFDQVVQPTERLQAFKRPAPPRKKRGARPRTTASAVNTQRMSGLSEEYDDITDGGTTSASDVTTTNQSIDIPLPANVRNYMKSKKSGAHDNKTEAASKPMATVRLETTVQLRKSGIVAGGSAVARAQSLKSAGGDSSNNSNNSSNSRPSSRPISSTFQPLVDRSLQGEDDNLTKLRKDSNEEVELLTESVNVRQIVQRLSCPQGATATAIASAAGQPRPKTYTDASDLSAIISSKRSNNNIGADMSSGLTVA